jgi:16S rRNA (uracil1498-N3)-methyltransferase
MKLHRFLVESIEFVEKDARHIVLGAKKYKDLLHQLVNVFRIKPGSQFVLFDGSGVEFLVEVASVDRKEVICEVKEEKQGLRRNKKLTLCFSMIKKENMELVLNMCTQLGVTHFVPFISERTVKIGWNRDRMEKIVREAVEQSGFSDIPSIEVEPVKLSKLLEKFKKENESLEGNFDNFAVLDFSGTLLSTVKHLISVDTIFVGPEGGFTEKEVELFRKHNIKVISLGSNTLRAETACVSISSIFLL